jgi:hypothetical protein
LKKRTKKLLLMAYVCRQVRDSTIKSLFASFSTEKEESSPPAFPTAVALQLGPQTKLGCAREAMSALKQ